MGPEGPERLRIHSPQRVFKEGHTNSIGAGFRTAAVGNAGASIQVHREDRAGQAGLDANLLTRFKVARGIHSEPAFTEIP